MVKPEDYETVPHASKQMYFSVVVFCYLLAVCIPGQTLQLIHS